MSLQLQPYTQEDLNRNPRLREALLLLGSGKVSVAIDDLKSQTASGLAGAAFLLAAVYFKEQRFEDAVTHVNCADQLTAHSPAWTLCGAASLRIGNIPEAYAAIKRALDLDWKNVQAHRFAWTALDAMGLAPKARRLAMSVIERDYSSVHGPSEERPLDLAGMTAIAIDCIHPALAARALRISSAYCRFDAVKLLTSTGYRYDGVATINIPHISSKEAYSAFVIQELHRYVDTEFVLLMQWDGYVICPAAWTPEFLNYDYIGARWVPAHLEKYRPMHDYDVGNGGFSLRSLRLMKAVAKHCKLLPSEQLHPEDAVVCRKLRPALEATSQIRFAPGALADRFAVEHSITGQPTFGFHDIINLSLAINEPAYSRLEFLDPLKLNQ